MDGHGLGDEGIANALIRGYGVEIVVIALAEGL
jgi:hypothetical protein